MAGEARLAFARSVDQAVRSRCIACGCRRTRPLYEIGGYHYVACPGCGLARLDPLPDERDVLAFFDEAYFTGGRPGGYDDYEADAPLHRRNARLRLDRLELDRVGRPGNSGRLLDVGCAYGYVLDEARRRGWQVTGVDVSPAVAERARLGGAVNLVPDLGEVARDEPGGFDVVTMFQLLEHLHDPERALAQAATCLRPGGLLVLETWNRASLVARLCGRHWQLLAPPSVLWAFDEIALRLLLQHCGFEVLRYETAKKYVSLSFSASLLASDERTGVPAAVGRLLQRLPLPRGGLSYRLGDLVWVVAALT